MNVVKSNVLIQKTRYCLSVQEQKILFYLVSKIQPEDKELLEYSFEIKDFCKLVGIDWSNGANYAYIKNTILELTKKVFWLDTGESEITVRWLDRGEILKGSGCIKLKLDKYLMPYLLELKSHFTQYNLYFILAMRSQYSVRLYELLKSYQNCSKWTFDIEDLKKKLNADNYDRWFNFNKKVLSVALKEIELYTDLNIKFDLIKKGRKYDKITFYINQKTGPSMEVIENVQLQFKECCPWDR